MLTYNIVTAARNEILYIGQTLESVTSQNVKPVEWVIIDDGSDDGTTAIIESYAKKFAWIKLIRLDNFMPDLKTTGGRVGRLLNIAVKSLNASAALITKLDADTEFGPDFFQSLISEFEREPKLGIASGNLVFEGKVQKMGKNETKGAVMVIRQEVFDQVGGFFESRGRGEDILFSVAARSFGWKTGSFPYYFNHLKPEGGRHSSFHQAYVTGFYKGSIPYRFDFFLFTQVKHLFKKPVIVGTFIQVWAYVKSRFIERYCPFPDYVGKQLRDEQKQKLYKRF